MTIDDIHEDINNLMSISQNVRQYVDNGLYNADIEETIPTPSSILLNCYYFILEDLRDLGITPLNPEDFLSNFYSARVLMRLRDLLSAETLFRDLSASEEYTASLLSFLETDENFINEFIQYIYSHNKSENKFLMEEGLDRFQVSEKLSHHIQTIASLISSGSECTEYDEEEYVTYINSINKHVQELRDIYTRISHFIRADKAKVVELIERHDVDKLEPETASVYIKKGLYGDNPLFKEIYEKVSQRHKKKNEHHIEFWKVHSEKRMSPEHLTEMIIDTSTDFTDQSLDSASGPDENPFENFISRFLEYREVYEFTDNEWEYVVYLGQKIFAKEL